MFKATKAIYEELQTHEGLKVFTEESEKTSSVWLQFALENGNSFRISLISNSDDNDVAVRVFGLVTVDKDMFAKILPIINGINNKYRFLKFTLDESNGDIDVAYDFLMHTENPEKSAFEIVIRLADVIKEVYPELMRSIWA